jgi:hypothetical protein
MTEAETAAKVEVLKLAAELEYIRRKALTLCESLPAPSHVTTEIRCVIRCVVHDMIEPAIRSLQDGAESRARTRKVAGAGKVSRDTTD